MSQNQRQKFNRRRFVEGLGASALAAATSAHLTSATAGAMGPRPVTKPVRIGIVGGGFGASFQWHLDPECKVVAHCDLRDDRLKRMAEAYGPAQTYKSFREFLKHPQMDAVAVFTPAPLHVWM